MKHKLTRVALTSSNEDSLPNPLKNFVNRTFLSASKRSDGRSSIALKIPLRSDDPTPFAWKNLCASSGFTMSSRAFKSFNRSSDTFDKKEFIGLNVCPSIRVLV